MPIIGKEEKGYSHTNGVVMRLFDCSEAKCFGNGGHPFECVFTIIVGWNLLWPRLAIYGGLIASDDEFEVFVHG